MVTGINDSGKIVGRYFAAGSVHGKPLSRGSYTSLDVPGAFGTLVGANGINDSGQIIGSYDVGGLRHGFLLSGGSYTMFDVPGEPITSVHGINNFGQIVGTYFDAGGIEH